MEYSIVPNNEEINNEMIIIYVDDSIDSDIHPLINKFWKLKEYTMKLKEGKLKNWTDKMKESTMKSYLLSSSTTMKEEPIGAPWYGTT